MSLADRGNISELAKTYKVTLSTIDKIAKVKNWAWVREDLNDQLHNIYSEKKKTLRRRNEKIKDMFRQGFSLKEIRNDTGSTRQVVNKVLGEDAFTVLHKRNAKIVEDFNKGLDKKTIIEKHNISSAVYVSVTKKCFNEKVEKERNEAIAMRLQGVPVQDIAKQLNRHRTTITEWTKHIIGNKGSSS